MAEQNFPFDPTAYQVLGVAADVSDQQLRSAYRKAARLAHPDVGGDAEKFHLVTQAWDLVSTPQARANYDQSLKARQVSSAPGISATSRRTYAPEPASHQPVAKKPVAETVVVPPLDQGPLTLTSPSGRKTVTVDAMLIQHPVLGEPRGKRKLFSRQPSMHSWLAESIMPELNQAFPSARLIHQVALKSSGSSVRVDSLILCGDKVAVLEAAATPPDYYRFDGQELHGAKKSLPLPDLSPQVTALQQAFPQLSVGGFIVLKSTDENPLAPEVKDVTTMPNMLGLAETPASLKDSIRALKLFFGTGAAYNQLNRHTLGELLLLQK